MPRQVRIYQPLVHWTLLYEKVYCPFFSFCYIFPEICQHIVQSESIVEKICQFCDGTGLPQIKTEGSRLLASLVKNSNLQGGVCTDVCTDQLISIADLPWVKFSSISRQQKKTIFITRYRRMGFSYESLIIVNYDFFLESQLILWKRLKKPN